MSSSNCTYHFRVSLTQSRVVERMVEGRADTKRHTALITLLVLTRAFPVWSQDGKTPLDWAKKEKHKSIVALLNHVLVSV